MDNKVYKVLSEWKLDNFKENSKVKKFVDLYVFKKTFLIII